eukprot:414579_1
MSLISRISRLSYGNRLVHRSSFGKMGPANGLYSPLRRFGHGPPTRIGFPHEWGAMKWFPCKGLLILVYAFQLQMFGFILWYKWDSIPYPVHRYHDENTTARNW